MIARSFSKLRRRITTSGAANNRFRMGIGQAFIHASAHSEFWELGQTAMMLRSALTTSGSPSLFLMWGPLGQVPPIYASSPDGYFL